jgi:addiction module RelE/StbE family toxin
MKTRWTETARGDLRAIRAHISRDSARYAGRVVQKIRAAIARLKSFPELGAVVEPWHRDDIREIYVGSYRIIYHVTARVIWIVTIIHAARLLPEHPGL